MEKKAITAHVPRPLAEKVDGIAERMDRSRTWVIKEALTEWVTWEEEKRRLTEEALAAVDAGQVSDHKKVQDWADSLDSDKPLPPPR